MYDESKRFAESATQAYTTTHNLRSGIARIFNTYGPNMAFDDGRVVSNFIIKHWTIKTSLFLEMEAKRDPFHLLKIHYQES